MGEPSAPRNRDRDVPGRSGEGMGGREPLGPRPGPQREDQRPPLPEEEPSEQDREEKRPEEEKPPVEGS
jgi:hypothetical protein